MAEETELQLLQSIKDHDGQAMRRLYDRYAGHALAIALRYVGSHEDARDVVQDSFVKILTSVSRFNYRGEGTLKAWVGRIVCNRAIDYVQSRQQMTFVSDVPDDTADPPPDVEQIAPDVLTRLIGQLPSGYRLVLNMYVFEELPHKTIAQRLGISESTSASQLNRAKKRLAQLIRNYLKHQENL